MISLPPSPFRNSPAFFVFLSFSSPSVSLFPLPLSLVYLDIVQHPRPDHARVESIAKLVRAHAALRGGGRRR